MSANVLWSLGVIAAGYLGMRVFKQLLGRVAEAKKVMPQRVFYIARIFELFIALLVATGLLFVWSVDIKGVSVVASSVFAIVGVAMFAQWSILSNVTASIIIFFSFPARVGDRVRIVDGDLSVEGEITEISLFQTEILSVEGHTVFYPNNLLLQKPVVKLKPAAETEPEPA